MKTKSVETPQKPIIYGELEKGDEFITKHNMPIRQGRIGRIMLKTEVENIGEVYIQITEQQLKQINRIKPIKDKKLRAYTYKHYSKEMIGIEMAKEAGNGRKQNNGRV